MKKIIYFIGVLFSLCFISCSQETIETSSCQLPENRFCRNQTLKELKALNDSIISTNMDMHETRSGNRMPWYIADATGAVVGGQIANQWAYLCGPFAFKAYVATVVLSAAVCSASALAESNAAPMLLNDYNSFYYVGDHNYSTQTQILDDTCQINNSLVNSINIPQSFRSLSYIGINHNAILLDWNSPQNTRTRSGGYLEPLDPGDPLQPINNLSPLYRDTLFRNSYDSTIGSINAVFNYYNGDFADYLITNYDNNISDACYLFFQASAYSNSTSDMITLVNQYISIVESNQDFTEDEKKVFYGGLIVAIFSFEYWNG